MAHLSRAVCVGSLLFTVITLSGCQQFGGLWSSGKSGNSSSARKFASPLVHGLQEPIRPVTDQQKADVQMVIGRSLEKKGLLDEAVKVYHRVLVKDSKRADTYQRLAVVHDLLGKHDESGKFYKQAIKRDPKNASIFADQGYSFYLQRRWAEAERSLRRALEIKPNSPRAHNNLALVLARNGQIDEAIMHSTLADNSEAEARSNVMHSLMLDKDFAEASRQCDLALASPTASDKVRQRLTHLLEKIDRSSNVQSHAAGETHSVHQVSYQARLVNGIKRLPPTTDASVRR